MDTDDAQFLTEIDELRLKRERELRLEEKRELEEVKISFFKLYFFNMIEIVMNINEYFS